MNELLESLQIEDLRSHNKELAEIVGIEAFKKLIEVYGGTSKLYVPVAEKVVIPVRDDLIRRELNGDNYFELAKRWKMSERYVREIVKDKIKEFKQRPISGQVTLSDFY